MSFREKTEKEYREAFDRIREEYEDSLRKEEENPFVIVLKYIAVIFTGLLSLVTAYAICRFVLANWKDLFIN